MKRWLVGTLVTIVAVAVATSGTALAQVKPTECGQASPSASAAGKAAAPDTIQGEVVKVDPAQNKITVKGSDGAMHEFTASKETLAQYKVGDKIEAKRRASNC